MASFGKPRARKMVTLNCLTVLQVLGLDRRDWSSECDDSNETDQKNCELTTTLLNLEHLVLRVYASHLHCWAALLYCWMRGCSLGGKCLNQCPYQALRIPRSRNVSGGTRDRVKKAPRSCSS